MAYLYFFIVLLLIFFRKSKQLRLLTMLLLLALFCLNTQIADREATIIDMDMVYSGFKIVEPLWGAILNFFAANKIDVQYLYVIIGLVYIPTLFYVVGKMSNNSNIAIACYMIGLFYMDVVQLRFTTAITIVLWGIYFLYYSKAKHGMIYFVLAVAISMTVHISSIIFALLALPKILSIKKTLVVTVVGSIVLFLSYTVAIAYFGDLFDIADKVQMTGEAELKSAHSFITTTISDIMVIFMAVIARYNLKSKNETYKRNLNIALIIALLSFLCVPLINFSPDIRRHVYVFYLLVAAFVYGCYPHYKGKAIVLFTPIVIAFMYFILSVYTGNKETVFDPLFQKNLLIEIFD